ncbi:hypothetical protein O181_005982 [Austropuccinia psidii MF-1]|uniref:Integrase catalytic domain-containing protein n=1 Tax=Austropuccinia psidii MF-1 TaxID=1389203 RepID=A0A9Q3BJ60_9BASI|nr:hypothetical protein [Austropuccinia psidii MF-1]
MNFENNAKVNSIPILNNSNYGEWVARMTILLRSKDLLDVCEKPIPSDLSTTATNKWNKSSFDAISIISCRVSNRVFIEIVKQFSKNAHLLWIKLKEQYASKRQSTGADRTLMMALETVNITIPDECHSFSLLGKLSGDSKLNSYVEVLTLNEELVKNPELVLAKLQEFHDNSSSQEKSIPSLASALVSESAHPYKITYFCSNGKHNPMCTTHSKNECYAENPHLRPPRRNNKRKNQALAHLSTAQALITRNKLEINSQELIIDCGATHHMFNSPRYFTSFTQTPEIKISTGDSSSTLVSVGTGTVVILCDNQVLTLENSLLVPRLNCDLVIPESYSTSAPLNLWHEILGHPGNLAIKSMGLPTIDAACSTCDLNKMRMLPFNDHFGDVSQPLDCVHLDLVGPISPASISGFRYFLTIVDQATSFKITVVSDRGGEFVNEKFKNLAEVNGFTHILSPPETPQHDGFAERANRTIIEKARCLLNSSNLPKRYWAEAVRTATFLSNLIPTPSRSNHIPYAIWRGLPPRIKRLQVFGCRAIISIPKSQQDWKFNAVGAEGVLLGYANDNTAYCILRLSDLKVVISKHVKFEESIFPCIQAPSLRDEAWIVPWNNQLESTELVDEFRQSDHSFVDEVQTNDLLHSVEDSSRLVDEAQESSSSAAAVEIPVPVNHPRIKVIGSRHPTLIKGSIDGGNILPYHRRPKTLFNALVKLPRTFSQAVKSSDKESWQAAIDKELSLMNRLHVWDIVDLLPDYKLVGTTWVFRIKKDHLNNVTEYKARLCAQGFTQTPGVDFKKTYAPTGRLNSLRCFISYASSRGLKFHQIDIRSAFLNAPLSEVVYLSVPQGLDLDKRASCLRLNKAIYGLKQAPLAWYQRLKQWLLQAGFSACVLDSCVFYRSKDTMTWLYIHVDDITIFGEDVSSFIKEISDEFDIKDMGPADLMLGIRVVHGYRFISLDQSHFTDSLLDLYGLSHCKRVSTPLEPNVHLQPASDEEVEKFLSLGINYRSAIGSISYLSTATRPDLSHTVSSLSQFLERPGICHWNGFLHVLRYLKGTQNAGLVYSQGLENEVRGYSDADWGNCRTTRRSVTGFLALFAGNLVLWKTRKQPTVSISTAKAEYKALCDLVSELLWLWQWSRECHLLPLDSAIPVHEDNQSCINTANGDCNLNNRRMKHVDIQLHFIKEAVRDSIINIIYTPTSLMLADFLTKSVCRPILSWSMDSLRIVELGVRGDVENYDPDQDDRQCATPRSVEGINSDSP